MTDLPIEFILERSETDLFFENQMLMINKKSNFLLELINRHVDKGCESFSKKFIAHTINRLRERGCFRDVTDDYVIKNGLLKNLTKISIGENVYGVYANYIDDKNRGDLISSYSIVLKIV